VDNKFGRRHQVVFKQTTESEVFKFSSALKMFSSFPRIVFWRLFSSIDDENIEWKASNTCFSSEKSEYVSNHIVLLKQSLLLHDIKIYLAK
jgi:hypothetical protein